MGIKEEFFISFLYDKSSKPPEMDHLPVSGNGKKEAVCTNRDYGNGEQILAAGGSPKMQLIVKRRLAAVAAFNSSAAIARWTQRSLKAEYENYTKENYLWADHWNTKYF
ncbi:MAG: hypothetical protein LLF76_01940 [Planctomycetaceae bacterium]|nr:hypothetical protein [Planctomycetaceae bacterium]